MHNSTDSIEEEYNLSRVSMSQLIDPSSNMESKSDSKVEKVKKMQTVKRMQLIRFGRKFENNITPTVTCEKVKKVSITDPFDEDKTSTNKLPSPKRILFGSGRSLEKKSISPPPASPRSSTFNKIESAVVPHRKSSLDAVLSVLSPRRHGKSSALDVSTSSRSSSSEGVLYTPRDKKNSNGSSHAVSPNRSPRRFKIIRKSKSGPISPSATPIASPITSPATSPRGSQQGVIERRGRQIDFYDTESEQFRGNGLSASLQKIYPEKISIWQKTKPLSNEASPKKEKFTLKKLAKSFFKLRMEPSEIKTTMNSLPFAKSVQDFKKSLKNNVTHEKNGKNLSWSEIKDFFKPLMKEAQDSMNSDRLSSAAEDVWRIADKYVIGVWNDEGNNIITVLEAHPNAYEGTPAGVDEHNKRFYEIVRAFKGGEIISLPDEEEWKNWTKHESAGKWAEKLDVLQNPLFCRYLYSFNQSRYTASTVASLISTKYGIRPREPIPPILAKADIGNIRFSRVFFDGENGSREIIEIPVNITSRNENQTDKDHFILKIQYLYDQQYYMTQVITSVV